MRKALFCLFIACLPVHADQDTFRERFADPATRTAALAELIPGSREAYHSGLVVSGNPNASGLHRIAAD